MMKVDERFDPKLFGFVINLALIYYSLFGVYELY